MQPVPVVTETALRDEHGQVIREEVTVAQVLRDPARINVFLHEKTQDEQTQDTRLEGVADLGSTDLVSCVSAELDLGDDVAEGGGA